MAFYIYDNKGYRIPYNPGDKWRQTERVVPVSAFDEKSREDHKHEQDTSSKYDKEKEEEKQRKFFKEKTVVVASQIMSHPVISLSPDNTLEEAWKIFDQKRFRHIPIVDSNKKIVGIISDRTMLHEAVEFVKHVPEGEDNRCVKEVMIKNVLCAQPNTDISQIAKIFIEERVGAMPIVNPHGILEGILTRSDILRTIIKIQTMDVRI